MSSFRMAIQIGRRELIVTLGGARPRQTACRTAAMTGGVWATITFGDSVTFYCASANGHLLKKTDHTVYFRSLQNKRPG
jgi:hypothetical protein